MWNSDLLIHLLRIHCWTKNVQVLENVRIVCASKFLIRIYFKLGLSDFSCDPHFVFTVLIIAFRVFDHVFDSV